MLEPLLVPRTACLLLALASASILVATLALQHLGGLAPCHLCVLQRWPYVALAGLGLIGWCWQPRPPLALSVIVLLVSAGLAGYHVGVEQGWLALPESCAAGGSAQSIDELKQLLADAPPACDQVGFSLLGLSLAEWNLVSSLALAGYAAAAALIFGRRTA